VGREKGWRPGEPGREGARSGDEGEGTPRDWELGVGEGWKGGGVGCRANTGTGLPST
jgi:hypothetical protein